MLPSVVIVEKGVCAICLEEWSKGDLATELPCKHKYHLECIDKWLKIHSTCPQCRYVVENIESSVDVDVDVGDDSSSEDNDSSDSDSDE
ncbi:E3 ubiquitin-protein ligase MPSR1 [Cardamine amara subsp. amara]|uniref:E3 ubiquitin-protein ligase MPSR1 n=1 Tax=Cardamine amara subsp. amara TaxID=228776 RepID=A0ABD1BIB0_CARAN